MLNIALTGAMRSGKDTIAAYLEEHYDFKRYAFGDGIRDICNRLYPDQMRDSKPRSLLQGVGQSLRAFDNDVWVNRLLNEIEADRAMELVTNVVVSDLRQPNEYERLKSEGYIIIRVNAKSALRIERMEALGDQFNAQDLMHDTERHVGGFTVDYELYNDSGYTALYTQIDYVMNDIKAKQSKSLDDVRSQLEQLKKDEEYYMNLAAVYERSNYPQRELMRVRQEIRLLSQLLDT